MATVQGPPLKRPRAAEGDETISAGALVVAPPAANVSQHHRSSSLPAPTLKLSGHTGSVYSLKYSPSGATLCSTSFDKTCLLWSHYSNTDEFVDFDAAEAAALSGSSVATYDNFNVLTGHKNAVLDCAWCDEEAVVTASADKTLMLWDVTTGTRLRKWPEHSGIVNAVDTFCNTKEPHSNSIVSASDDGTCLLWDRRQKRRTAVLPTEFPILAVAASAVQQQQVYTSGIDPKIHAWDVRHTQHPVYSMSGHTDTVTSLAMHPAETHVLSNSMDQSLQSWDIRPFCGNKRHCQTFTGHTHSAEKGLLKCAWSSSHDDDGNNNNMMVSAGSSDHRVHIWDQVSTAELYDLPGHTGCVNAVAFHPKEKTVIASGSSDKQIYVGELSS